MDDDDEVDLLFSKVTRMERSLYCFCVLCLYEYWLFLYGSYDGLESYEVWIVFEFLFV